MRGNWVAEWRRALTRRMHSPGHAFSRFPMRHGSVPIKRTYRVVCAWKQCKEDAGGCVGILHRWGGKEQETEGGGVGEASICEEKNIIQIHKHMDIGYILGYILAYMGHGTDSCDSDEQRHRQDGLRHSSEKCRPLQADCCKR